MARPFVVERKAFAVMADERNALFEGLPGGGRRRKSAVRRERASAGRGIPRPERVHRQRVLHVGEEQLLVLLLVVGAEERRGQRVRIGGRGGREQREHL